MPWGFFFGKIGVLFPVKIGGKYWSFLSSVIRSLFTPDFMDGGGCGDLSEKKHFREKCV